MGGSFRSALRSCTSQPAPIVTLIRVREPLLGPPVHLVNRGVRGQTLRSATTCNCRRLPRAYPSWLLFRETETGSSAPTGDDVLLSHGDRAVTAEYGRPGRGRLGLHSRFEPRQVSRHSPPPQDPRHHIVASGRQERVLAAIL